MKRLVMRSYVEKDMTKYSYLSRSDSQQLPYDRILPNRCFPNSEAYSGQKAECFCTSLLKADFLWGGPQNIKDFIFARIQKKYWTETGVMTSFLVNYVWGHEN